MSEFAKEAEANWQALWRHRPKSTIPAMKGT